LIRFFPDEPRGIVRKRTSAIALSLLVAAILAGCSSLGGSFGETARALPDPPDLQFVAADQVLPAARKNFKEDNFGYSAAYYKRALELTPNDDEALVGLAASYDRLRRFDLSDRVYAQLLKVDGGSAQYYNNLGYSYMLRGNLPAARASFLKAYDLEPANPVVGNNLELLSSTTSG
jgi:Flp pilus assembly protein TadD